MPLQSVTRTALSDHPVIVAHERTPFTEAALLSHRIDALITQDPGHLVRSAIRILRAGRGGREVLAGARFWPVRKKSASRFCLVKIFKRSPDVNPSPEPRMIDNLAKWRNLAWTRVMQFATQGGNRMPRAAILLGLLTVCCGPPVAAEVPLPVELVTVELSQTQPDYTLAGTIEAKDSVPTAFRDGGRLVSVAVHAGDHVTPGQELARTDATQADAARRSAEASLTGAEASLLQATSAYQRAQGLVNSGVATRPELDAAGQAQAAAQSARDQAAAQVKKAQAAVTDTVLLATVAAVVTARQAEPGQVVAAGQTVLTLATEAAREAVFLAPDSVNIIPFIGSPLKVTLIDRPDVVLDAVLTEASPVVDAATSTVRVKARILTLPGPDLMLGAAVLGHLKVKTAPAIHVPSDALSSTAAGPAVWTVDAATMIAQLTPVVIAGFGAQDVTIASGLKAGDLVVGAGSQLLYPGRAVVKAEVAP